MSITKYKRFSELKLCTIKSIPSKLPITWIVYKNLGYFIYDWVVNLFFSFYVKLCLLSLPETYFLHFTNKTAIALLFVPENSKIFMNTSNTSNRGDEPYFQHIGLLIFLGTKAIFLKFFPDPNPWPISVWGFLENWRQIIILTSVINVRLQETYNFKQNTIELTNSKN